MGEDGWIRRPQAAQGGRSPSGIITFEVYFVLELEIHMKVRVPVLVKALSFIYIVM